MARSLVFATALIAAMPSMAGDAGLFYTPNTTRQNQALVATRGNSAPIDNALLKIVPPPYRVVVDSTVPASMVLVWGQGDNWMRVLANALAPVGLVAVPDWGRNVITVTWDNTPAGRLAASSAVPVSGMSGSFEMVKPKTPSQHNGPGSFGQPMTGNPVLKLTAPESSQSSGVAGAGASIKVEWTFAVDKEAQPGANEMWGLMKAAVSGKRILLLGHSGAKSESSRIWYANNRAKKMRERLIDIGFPADLVVVNERGNYALSGDKPRVSISVVQGEV